MSSQSAWERWELASFDPPQPNSAAPHAAATETAPEATGPTPEELSIIRDEARNIGYREGYAEGQDAVHREAGRLGRAADRLDQSLADLDQAVAGELLALALELARQIVRSELKVHPEAILDVVREALAQLPHHHAVIFLHPEDASLIRTHLGDSLSHVGHRIVEEPTLERGDCLLEAGSSQLDATVATRWRRVVEGLGQEVQWSEPQHAP